MKPTPVRKKESAKKEQTLSLHHHQRTQELEFALEFTLLYRSDGG